SARDDAQVIQAGVLDCDRQGRKGEIGNLELPVRQRSDLLWRAVEEDRFQHVGLAEVPREVLFLQQNRAPTAGGGDPGHPDLDRLGSGCRAKREDGENSQQRCLQDTHYAFLSRKTTRVLATRGLEWAEPRGLRWRGPIAKSLTRCM